MVVFVIFRLVPIDLVKISLIIVSLRGMISVVFDSPSVSDIISPLPFFLQVYTVLVNLMSQPSHFILKEFRIFSRLPSFRLFIVFPVRQIVSSRVIICRPGSRLLYRSTKPMYNVLVFSQFFSILWGYPPAREILLLISSIR